MIIACIAQVTFCVEFALGFCELALGFLRSLRMSKCFCRLDKLLWRGNNTAIAPAIAV